MCKCLHKQSQQKFSCGFTKVLEMLIFFILTCIRWPPVKCKACSQLSLFAFIDANKYAFASDTSQTGTLIHVHLCAAHATRSHYCTCTCLRLECNQHMLNRTLNSHKLCEVLLSRLLSDPTALLVHVVILVFDFRLYFGFCLLALLLLVCLCFAWPLLVSSLLDYNFGFVCLFVV